MTRHDLGMMRFSQWVAADGAVGTCDEAQLFDTHGAPAPLHLYRRQLHRSTVFWTMGVSGVGGGIGVGDELVGAFAVAAGVFVFGVAGDALSAGTGGFVAAGAGVCVFYGGGGKFPQMAGMLSYYWNVMRRRRPRLIEYKGVGVAEGSTHPAGGAVGNT